MPRSARSGASAQRAARAAAHAKRTAAAALSPANRVDESEGSDGTLLIPLLDHDDDRPVPTGYYVLVHVPRVAIVAHQVLVPIPIFPLARL